MPPPPRTPSQTIGPFFGFALAPDQYGCAGSAIGTGTLVESHDAGQRLQIVGRVLDGAGAVIPDALVEIWQADTAGRYRSSTARRLGDRADRGFAGFGRVGTGVRPDGRFVFQTVKPGSVDGVQAPHVHVTLFMRGLLRHVFTRIYFSDEEAANRRDPVLLTVPAGRRSTLIARRTDPSSVPSYGFDIHMQGDRETVFFDV